MGRHGIGPGGSQPTDGVAQEVEVARSRQLRPGRPVELDGDRGERIVAGQGADAALDGTERAGRVVQPPRRGAHRLRDHRCSRRRLPGPHRHRSGGGGDGLGEGPDRPHRVHAHVGEHRGDAHLALGVGGPGRVVHPGQRRYLRQADQDRRTGSPDPCAALIEAMVGGDDDRRRQGGALAVVAGSVERRGPIDPGRRPSGLVGGHVRILPWPI